jgi:hypothetical protein
MEGKGRLPGSTRARLWPTTEVILFNLKTAKNGSVEPYFDQPLYSKIETELLRRHFTPQQGHAAGNGSTEPQNIGRAISVSRRLPLNLGVALQETFCKVNSTCNLHVLYCHHMSKLFEEAIAKIRELPEEEQDAAANALIRYADEIPTLRDQVAISEGREAYGRGEFVSLDHWRHEMGLGNH